MIQRGFLMMETITTVPYEQAMYAECASMLAKSFVANPLHIRAFGNSVGLKNHSFFSIGLDSFRGRRLVAVVDGEIVGFIHWVHSSCCQFSAFDKMSALPRMISKLGLPATINVSRWLSRWEKLDPAHEHLHLGPIAVKASMQGRGVGATLMKRFCLEADSLSLDGYLETDALVNVKFYESFGFVLIKEAEVLGITNFFMIRSP